MRASEYACRIKPWHIALLLVALGFACLSIDVPFSRLFADDATPGEIQAILGRAEVFGHGYGVAGIAITMLVIDVANRHSLPRMLLCAYGAGISADLIKICTWRTRPFHSDLTQTVYDTFIGNIFFSTGPDVSLMDSACHSLPSAHTATAVGLAVALARIYPRGRWWFATLAALVAMNRICGMAHFASDVCWGAALGMLVGNYAWEMPLPARWSGQRSRGATAFSTDDIERRAAQSDAKPATVRRAG